MSQAASFPQRLKRGLEIVAAFSGGRPVRLFCQDEARIGLHLPRYRRLTARGVQPRQPVAPLYEYYWLYGAVEPTTGESFYLEMPALDSDCFSVFLGELARTYRQSVNVVVLDNAPAHGARRVAVPENVVLLFLPAYSPELNPVELLWREVRRRIDVFDRQVRSSLSALREHVAEHVRGLSETEVRSITGYRYLLEAAQCAL